MVIVVPADKYREVDRLIVAFIIWSICTAIFLGIAIISRRSEKPAGFFANVKPPEVNDIKSYNRAVSNIWIVGAVIFEILGIPFLFLEQNSPGFLLVVLAVPFWAIGMMAAYLKTSARYTKRL